MLSMPLLLALGALLMAVMTASCWAVMRQERLDRAMARRIQDVAVRHGRANALQRMGRRTVPLRSGLGTLLARLALLFGYDGAKAGLYPMRPAVVIGLALVPAGLAGHLLTEFAGSVARLAIPVLWVLVSRRLFMGFEQRHASRLYVQFPDALAMIVRAVRVGIPVSEAIRNVSREALEPTCTEFAVLGDQCAIGVALDQALTTLAARNGLPEYRFFATALSLQAQTGGGLTETLEGLADVIRKRVAVRKRAHAMASEARTSTYVLAALPIFTGAVLGLVNPGYISLLFTTSSGLVVLATAVGMLASGMLVMRSIISRSLR